MKRQLNLLLGEGVIRSMHILTQIQIILEKKKKKHNLKHINFEKYHNIATLLKQLLPDYLVFKKESTFQKTSYKKSMRNIDDG